MKPVVKREGQVFGEAAKKLRLFSKKCADCGHVWSQHFRDGCTARGTNRATKCLCSSFTKREGDSL